MGRQSNVAIVEARREKVGQLLLMGLTQREIERALDQQRILNPKTRRPWSLGTINADIQAMETAWREQALQSRSDQKAKVAAELKLLKRKAWVSGDYDLVRKLLKDERDMFGLDEPIAVDMRTSGSVDVNHNIAQPEDAVSDMDEDELDNLIANLMTRVEISPPGADVIEGQFERREANETSVVQTGG